MNLIFNFEFNLRWQLKQWTPSAFWTIWKLLNRNFTFQSCKTIIRKFQIEMQFFKSSQIHLF